MALLFACSTLLEGAWDPAESHQLWKLQQDQVGAGSSCTALPGNMLLGPHYSPSQPSIPLPGRAGEGNVLFANSHPGSKALRGPSPPGEVLQPISDSWGQQVLSATCSPAGELNPGVEGLRNPGLKLIHSGKMFLHPRKQPAVGGVSAAHTPQPPDIHWQSHCSSVLEPGATTAFLGVAFNQQLHQTKPAFFSSFPGVFLMAFSQN